MVDEKIKQAYEEAQRSLVSTLLYQPGPMGTVISTLDDEDFSDGVARTIYQAMVEVYRESKNGVTYPSVIYQPGPMGTVISTLDDEDFSDGVARTIYQAMVEVYRESKNGVTYPSVISCLVDTGKIVEAGGLETLQQYFQEGAAHGTSSTISSYVRTIKNVSSKLRLRKLSSELEKMTDEPDNNADSVIRYGRKVLDDEMLSLSNSQDAVEVSEYFSKEDGGYLSNLRKKYKIFQETGGNPLKAAGGIPSSFDKINEVTGGWLPGQLNVIGARTGIGKSFFLVDEAVTACIGGSSVLMFSLEMLKDELLDRIVCAYSMTTGYGGVTLSQLKKGQMSEKELEGVEALQDTISGFKLTIDTTPSISLDHIRAKAKQLQLKKGQMSEKELEGVEALQDTISGFKLTIDTTPSISLDHIRAKAKQLASSETGLSMIIIDYLQLIQPPKGERSNRERQVADISRGLKLLSMELQVPVIVAAQLNRTNKDDADPTPTINDLRESNAIAQDASVIVLIHRDTARNAEGGYDPATFIIGKNRNGQSGIRFRCETKLNMATFAEVKSGVDDFEDSDDDESNEIKSTVDDPMDGGAHETMGSIDIDDDEDDDVFGSSSLDAGDPDDEMDEAMDSGVSDGGFGSTADDYDVSMEDDDDEEW